MTAINIIRQSNAVHIISDGAAYNATTGELMCEGQKVWSIGHLKAAIAVRGSPLFAPHVAISASLIVRTFDELIERAVGIIRESFNGTQLAISLSGSTEFELYIAGWSETRGPMHYFICNHDQHPTAKPWQLTDCGPNISLAPYNEEIGAELKRLFPVGRLPDRFDPTEDGLTVMEVQRRVPAEHRAGGMFPAAGAFVQLTSITRDKIETAIIRRWPDVTGEKISL